MAVLSYEQLVQVARAGGLPGDPHMWAAVGMAESSGRTDVVNSLGCVGIWQINQPVWVKTHPTWTVKWLQNPVNNAKAAAVVYRAQGMKAWEGYTGPDGTGSDGPWRQYYQKSSPNSVQPVDWWDDFWKGFGDGFDTGPGPEDLWDGGTSNDPGLGDVPGVGDLAKGVGTIAEAVQKTAVWLGNSRNWVRIGYVAGGGVLVAMGLAIVAKPLINATPGGKAVTKTAKSLTSRPKKTTTKAK